MGLAVGGRIIQSFGWHATFLSILPVAIILWIIINRFIHGDNKKAKLVEKEGDLAQADINTKSSRVYFAKPTGVGPNISGRQSLDVKGAITLAITIASFLLNLTYIGNGSNNVSAYPIQIIIVSLALLSIGSLTLFVLIERRAVVCKDMNTLNEVYIPDNIL